jgi:ubiquinone biosynthesis protein COQ9
MEESLEKEIIRIVVRSVVFEGWSNSLIKTACLELGIEDKVFKNLFPRGVIDIAVASHRDGDKKMVKILEGKDFDGVKTREKITFAIKSRLEVVQNEKEFVKKTMSFFSLPQNFLDGNQLIWGTSDTIWNFFGDQSNDYNYYTKRLILSGVYGSVVLFWLSDGSKDNSSTWEFLDRRIQNVMSFESFKTKVKADSYIYKNLKLPRQILSKIKKPSDKNNWNVPGTRRSS